METLREIFDGERFDGTHEGKIPSGILLGESPVLSKGVINICLISKEHIQQYPYCGLTSFVETWKTMLTFTLYSLARLTQDTSESKKHHSTFFSLRVALACKAHTFDSGLGPLNIYFGMRNPRATLTRELTLLTSNKPFSYWFQVLVDVSCLSLSII